MIPYFLLVLAIVGVNGKDVPRPEAQNCSTALKTVFTSAFAGIPWALEMVDACGKPQTGMLRQGFELPYTMPEMSPLAVRLPGNPDQCLVVETKEGYGTQYCTAHLHITKFGQVSFESPKEVYLGICVPDICSGSDLESTLESYSGRLPFISSTTKEVYCQEKDRPLTKKATAATIVLAIIVSLVLLGTLYELLFAGSSPPKPTPSTDQQAKNGTTQDTEEKNKRGMIGHFLMSFSAYSNMCKILSTQDASGHLEFLDGMRVMTAIWLMLGHIFIEGHNMTENFLHELEVNRNSVASPIINYFNLGTDSFLTISGFLTIFQTLNKFKAQKPTFGFFKDFLINRYWRLTPHFALVMFVYVSLFKFVADGPLMPRAPIEVNECEHTWWANVLYVNFIYPLDQCMVWTWYLTCDMIFHALSPVIVLAFFYYGWGGLVLPLVMIAGSSGLTGYISYVHQLIAFGEHDADYAAYVMQYYPHPHTRIGPFLVGTIAGFIFYRTKGKYNLSKCVQTLGWAVYSVLLFVVFGTCYYSQAVRPLTVMESALVNAVMRTLFAVAIAWFIYVCSMGKGGFFDNMLSWKAFKPLSKLSYGFYLVHPPIIRFYFKSSRRLIFFDNKFLIFFFAGLLCITFIVSTITTLLFEMPFSNLQRALRECRKEKKIKAN